MTEEEKQKWIETLKKRPYFAFIDWPNDEEANEIAKEFRDNLGIGAGA